MSLEQSWNSRNTVLSMLLETLEEGRLSHYVVKEYFDTKIKSPESSEGRRDKNFIMTLYMGTIEKIVYLDFIINSFSSVNTGKMKPVIKNILRMSVYQLQFMDTVPERAVLSEAQKLCEIRRLNGLKGFVNGVLHTVIRKKDEIEVPEYVEEYVPEWLHNLVVDQYGKDKGKSFFEAVNNKKNFVYAKMNTTAGSSQEIIRILESEDCKVREIPYVKGGIEISGFYSITELDAYKKGLIYIQDINSMRAAEAAEADNPKIIVDVCAAPGGKTIDLAIKYPNAVIISRDLSEAKINLIKENVNRLKLVNIQSQAVDAFRLTPELIGRADIVMADLPCSGLGVIAKKPDIKFRVKEKELESLKKLQQDILSVVSAYVKPGGVLIYSTCTINKGENEDNARWFSKNFDFKLVNQKQFLPGIDEGDGFYFAAFEKQI